MPNEMRRKLVQDVASKSSPVEDVMLKRKAVLDKKKSTGGMFDFLFKKRMERQKQMKDIYGDM